MPKPIRNEERLAVHALDDVFQGIKFAVMYMQCRAIVGVDCTVCHLREFPGQNTGICRRHLIALHLQNQLLTHRIVHLFLSLIHADTVLTLDQLGHPQMVGGFHGDGDVGNLLINSLLGSGQGNVGEHHLPVALVRHEVILTILRNEPPQTLSHVEYLELCEQIHQAVAGWRSRQSDDSLCQGTNLHECLESLAAPILERGEFVNHDSIVGEVCFLHEPRHVLAVDDVERGLPPKCRQPFFLRTDRNRVANMVQMLPLVDFLRPCVSCHSKRSDDENTPNLEAVEEQVVERRQRNHRFA